ncbi:MAG: hypothetical protein MJZ12_04060 [Prevotella sp.]|nr:hypothetical protein [Prevotella sp.]
MTYEHEILLILHEADPEKGLPLSAIVRNVYNMTAIDLFSSRPYDDVQADITKFLRTESAKKSGSIERTDTRGYYRLNKNSQTVQQLLLEFEVSEEDEWMM